MWAAYLLMAAPAVPQAERVAVVWHEQATVEAALQQRLVDTVAAVAGVPGEDVIVDPVALARKIVAFEVERAAVERLVQLQRSLQGAIERYRSGEFEQAHRVAAEIIGTAYAQPAIPQICGVAREAYTLQARIAWARGDEPGMLAALDAAVRLDPEATLSIRHVPPPVAQAYAHRRAVALAQRDRWRHIVVVPPDPQIPIEIEIDGQLGQRAVPPGDHFVVVRREGMMPVGRVVDAADPPLKVPAGRVVVESVFPGQRGVADLVCARLELDRIVLARKRAGRVGVQGFECGRGFREAWFQREEPGVTVGVRLAMSSSIAGRRPALRTTSLLATDKWPRPIVDEPVAEPRKWYKKAWVWVVVGAVVVAAGATATGVVLGTRSPDSVVEIDPSTFDQE